MPQLHQQVTITLDLTDMTRERYKEIITFLNSVSITTPDTLSYDPEMDYLSEVELRKLKELTQPE